MSSSVKLRKKREGSAVQRLKRDYLQLMKDPIPYIKAHPLPNDIFKWHYVIKGPENTPYENGYYHGFLSFPHNFPFMPPSIYMLTPNGRFKVKIKLCLSMSDFHPETWNPAWSVSTILNGLLSFMLDKEITYGSLHTLDNEKKSLAKQSLGFNLENNIFCELFPELVEEIKAKLNKETESKKIGNNNLNNSHAKNQESFLHFFFFFLILIIVFLIAFILFLLLQPIK